MEREDDAQLVHAVLLGDDTAFDILVEKHQKSVHALVWQKIGDFHYAEEITQDAFLRAYQKLSTLRNPSQFLGWLSVIANRLCLKWLRKQKSAKRLQSLEDTPVEEVAKSDYARYVSEQRETEATEHRFEIVKKLLDKLPEGERTTMVLHYLGEMTIKEISRSLGVSVETVKVRLYRARKRLRAEEELSPPAIRKTFDLDPFYQQWIDVEGFPVIASAKVNPYAVKEAVWIVRQMIGHRPDILRVQANHQERLSVLAIDESMANLPEYERVPEAARIWIAYTRDIVCGPCQATLAAEENLLFPDSSFPHFLIHQFAHTIHGGLKRLGPEFDNRLKASYEAAMEKGLWRGYYAASNRDEYWAEAAGIWFHAHNAYTVTTRAALKKYDPSLAKLLTEIFGDGDWLYTPPMTRTHLPHLQGFDSEDSPRYDGPFPWEIDAQKFDQQLADPNDDGDGKWVNLRLYPPNQLPRLLKSTTRGTDTIIFYVNPTGQEISFYTVDADGTENLRYHAVRNIFDFGTYAGAIWLIKDHTGEDLAVFRAEEKTGRIIIGSGPSTNGTVLETGRIIIGTGPPTTGTELAIDKPFELTRNNFTIKPGAFVILVHRGEPAITGGTAFNSYFRIGKTDPQNAQDPDIPNLAHFFQNGGRIELISHITANPLPRHSSEAQFGDIVISEIMWGLDGTSPTRQYIELYNASAHAYAFTDADVSLRFSTVSEEPLPEGAFPPLHNSDVRVKVIDRVSNKGWEVPGRSGNTSENKPRISMYRTIDYTTGDVPDGTLATSWEASTGRVNLPAPSYGTPGAKHLP